MKIKVTSIVILIPSEKSKCVGNGVFDNNKIIMSKKEKTEISRGREGFR